MTIVTADPVAPSIDAVQPWPGLDAFTEESSRFFCGRDAEADELFRHVQRDVVTVLFGQSGLGKTSLLQAGLFLRLRKAGFLPILIRLDYSAGAPAPVAQVKTAVERECTAARLSEAVWSSAEESLWSCFHHADRRLTDRAGNELVPVLVFDQFEEIFTQGLTGSGSRAATQRFTAELAELLENRPPETLEHAIEADPEIVERFRFDRQDYRIVVALREDFLAALEGLRTQAPSLGRNRYRLRRMTGAQGLDVLDPVPGLVDYDAAQEIIRFVGLARPEYSFGATNAGDAAEGFEVEPSLLSLVCRELNERRLALGLNGIGTDLLAGSRDKIIEEFYEGCLAGQPAPLRAFVEDDLLSDRGFRESVTLDTAHRVLSDGGVPLTALDEMVRRRLLRIEERSDVSRVEIIHDVLTPVIRRSRETRRLRQAEGAAAEREEALRREKQRVRRAYWLTAAMALLAVITIGVAWWGWSAKLEAERQRNLADQQRSIAEQQRIYAEQQQTFAEQQKKIAEQQRTAANDASKRAEENFTMAVTTADTMVSKVAERLRDIMGVPTDSIRDVLASAERAFDQIAAAAPKSQHLRWRRAAMLISFADTYQSLGDTTEALSRSQKAREIMLVLVNEDPGNAAWQQTLYNGHQRVGDVLSVQGDRAGALAEYRADLGISQRLAEKNPDSAEWQGALAASHQRVGDVLRDRGDRAAALTEYRADLGISQRLAEKDPGNARWQSDLAISHHRVGDVLSDQGDRAGALTEYRAALRICQRLAEKDPGNAEWQRALEVSHEKVGDVLSDQGDRAAALTEYRADLSITQRLTEKDPSNTQWQHGLAISHQRMGDVLRDQGDRAAALTEYRAELDIAQRLAEKDPGNADWQRSLLLTHERIGLVAYQKNDPAAALDAFEKAEKLARHVNEMNPTAATSAADLAEVQAQLKAVRQKIAAPAVAGKHKK